MTRIADPALAADVTAAERAWWRVTLPVTTRVGGEVAALDLSGAQVACFQHVVRDAALMLLPLVRAGARVRVAAVNPDSTDDAGAAYLAAEGAEVWAWAGMTDAEVAAGLDWLRSEPADAISDMGGELIAATAERGGRARGALEATRSGLHRLDGVDVPFPVLNWNDIELKDRIHNRHHVGQEAWPAFSDITGLAIHGRPVLVVGFGPVGQGVALRARALGAVVAVAELDPVRALDALHHGCDVVPLAEGLAGAAIVVTATGRDGVLGPGELRRLRDGAIVCNVGHTNREIDVAWLDTLPNDPVRRHVRRYELDGRGVYLLNRGNLLNLAAGAGVATEELFDPFSALILRGLAWVLTGGADGAPPGVQPYPAELEREIAELTLAARR